MPALAPFVRDQGCGPGVLCLHSIASSSSQWRQLSNLLSDRYRVLAVDGYGAGQSPEWPVGRAMRLSDEVDLAAPAIALAGDRFHLVGHSYGAAVAVKLALMHPARLRSLVLYEPTLLHLVAGADPASSPAAGIWHAANDAADAVARGDSLAAAERFIRRVTSYVRQQAVRVAILMSQCARGGLDQPQPPEQHHDRCQGVLKPGGDRTDRKKRQHLGDQDGHASFASAA